MSEICSTAGRSVADRCTTVTPSLHWSASDGLSAVPEPLVVEAPLAIEISYERSGQSINRVLAVTMCTPGADEDLAVGFLLGEGLIATMSDVVSAEALENNSRGEKIPTVRVKLNRAPREDLERISRGLVTSSACGLCGRVSLEGLPLRATARAADEKPLKAVLIASLPERLHQQQVTFFSTGGCHGAALCDSAGNVILVREDVGRHNAVDKLIGAALRGGIAVEKKILVLSGRASFELLQKAAMAGVSVVVAVGAPSSLAVSLAHAAGLTLLGFARGQRFNVYSHADRIDLQSHQTAAAELTSPQARDRASSELTASAAAERRGS